MPLELYLVSLKINHFCVALGNDHLIRFKLNFLVLKLKITTYLLRQCVSTFSALWFTAINQKRLNEYFTFFPKQERKFATLSFITYCRTKEMKKCYFWKIYIPGFSIPNFWLTVSKKFGFWDLRFEEFSLFGLLCCFVDNV